MRHGKRGAIEDIVSTSALIISTMFTILVLDINWFTHNTGERGLKLVSLPNSK